MIEQLTAMRWSGILCFAVATTTACAQDEARTGDVTVEYIAHASFRIHSDDGTTILIDPFASKVWLGYDFPPAAMSDVDAVLITHPHYDHDGGRYRDLPVPWPEGTRIIDSAGTYAIGDITVTGVPGKHADPYGMEFGQINTIWLVSVDEFRIAHVGDNGPLTEETVTTLGRVDILMLPIDEEYHILAESEIQEILMAVRPSFLIPMHYRHPDLEVPGKPQDLGSIDAWVADKAEVLRLDGNVHMFNLTDLPDEPVIVVFQHSPDVRSP